MCELPGLVMLVLQLLSHHVATSPVSAAVAFSHVAYFEKSHMQYLVKQCKVRLSHLQYYDVGEPRCGIYHDGLPHSWA